ncbi:hypothetical protein GHT06_013503 [Daphnia sinensis]|uniref:Uncharacterized protein n=1 Tax=Daphnia sinensis TaxID=1820382 RepID=A0AAD5KTY8_9CRUS|nr:hypothetical protein GHT06_013503 [Daphnia sinensis]
MNNLGVILTGKDWTNLFFCPLLHRRIRNNTIPENDFQDSDNDKNPIEGDNLSDETESDSYDLQMRSLLQQISKILMDASQISQVPFRYLKKIKAPMELQLELLKRNSPLLLSLILSRTACHAVSQSQ